MRRANPRRAIDGAVVGSVATGLAGQLMLVASGILVARALGVEGRGQLAVIVLVPSVLSQLGTLGVPLAVTYYVARDPDGGRRLLRSLAGVICAQVVVLTIVQVGVFWLLVNDDERAAMLAAVPVMPALIAQQYGLAVLQGRQRFMAFNVLRFAPAALYAIALIVLFVVGATALVDVVLAWTATNVIVGLALALVAVRYASAGNDRSSDYPLRGVIRYGCSAVIGSSSPTEMLRVDQAVIAVSLSRTALGLYVVALAFTNLPRLISQSVGMVAYPRIAMSAHTDTRALVRQYLVLVVVVAGIVVVSLEIAVGWLIPRLFGTDFAGAVTAAQILLVASFCLAVRRLLTDVAQGLGYPISGTVAEIVNLALALPLIAIAAPLYGIEGASVAVTLGAAGSLAVLAIMVKRRMVQVGEPQVVDVRGGRDPKPIAPGAGDATS